MLQGTTKMVLVDDPNPLFRHKVRSVTHKKVSKHFSDKGTRYLFNLTWKSSNKRR